MGLTKKHVFISHRFTQINGRFSQKIKYIINESVEISEKSVKICEKIIF